MKSQRQGNLPEIPNDPSLAYTNLNPSLLLINHSKFSTNPKKKKYRWTLLVKIFFFKKYWGNGKVILFLCKSKFVDNNNQLVQKTCTFSSNATITTKNIYDVYLELLPNLDRAIFYYFSVYFLSYLNVNIKSHTYWWPWTIGCGHITRPVKVAKILMRRFPVTRCKFVFENFCADSINRASKVSVRYSSVSGFDAPQRFTQFSDLKHRIYNESFWTLKNLQWQMGWTQSRPRWSRKPTSSEGDDVHNKY